MYFTTEHTPLFAVSCSYQKPNPNYLKKNENALNHTTGMFKGFAGFMLPWVKKQNRKQKTKQTVF